MLAGIKLKSGHQWTTHTPVSHTDLEANKFNQVFEQTVERRDERFLYDVFDGMLSVKYGVYLTLCIQLNDFYTRR
jgi:hypothetical protein